MCWLTIRTYCNCFGFACCILGIVSCVEDPDNLDTGVSNDAGPVYDWKISNDDLQGDGIDHTGPDNSVLDQDDGLGEFLPCKNLDEQECLDLTICEPIYGSYLNDINEINSGYAGCLTSTTPEGAGIVCGSVVSCAISARSAVCFRIPFDCPPDGWNIVDCNSIHSCSELF